MSRAWAGLVGALAAMLASGAGAQDAPMEGPRVDAPGKLPEPPLSVPDLAYDSRVMSSFASAESFQGPLSGRWRLALDRPPDSFQFYEVQLVDDGQRIEGAWRNLHAKAAASSSVIDSIDRTPAGVSLRFDGAVVTLKPDRRGELQRGGEVFPVVMLRLTD